MIEEGIAALVLADTATNALITGRFSPNNLPTIAANTAPAMPACTYRVVSTTDVDPTLDGPSGLVRVRLQIDSYGQNYAGARAVSSALRALLNWYSGPLPNGCVVSLMTRDAEQSGFDEYVRLPYIQTDWLILFSD